MYSHPQLLTAMCAALAPQRVALNFELPADGTVPDWVELIPAGPEVIGRDGRRWLLDTPDEVIADTQAIGRDVPLDWEHATEIKAPHGDEAPAAAWIVAFENRDGAIWGRIDWTPRGRASVANREYRYLSPVFQFERESGRIVRLLSAGLTNSPNLPLTALNRGDEPGVHQEDSSMNLAAILKALGLPATSTADDAATAINTMQRERDEAQRNLETARNAAQAPSLEKFVPRGDYDAALERATNAEKKLDDTAKATREAEIDTAINAALEAGKITPATVDYHKAACRQEGGLAEFKKYVEAAPAVGGDSGLDGKQAGGDGATALNAEQQRIAAMFGNSAEDIAKHAAA